MKAAATILGDLIEGHFGCDNKVTETHLADADFLDTLNPDILDLHEVIMLIEEEFSVEITDDEAEKFFPNSAGTTRPLSELVALIDAKKMDQAA